MKTNIYYIYYLSYLSHFFLEREIFQTKVVKKIKTHISSSETVFLKPCRLWDNVKKILYSGAGNRRQYGACASHAGYITVQIHTLRLQGSQGRQGSGSERYPEQGFEASPTASGIPPGADF
jgi:hypothetical protein